MADEEEEKPFAVERAKTGRAKCKKCKLTIEKDTVRIAKLMANPFSEGKMKAWHHISCLFEVFAKQRATTKRIDDPEEDVSGWNELPDDDKKELLEKIQEFEDSSPFKGKAPTKAKTPAKKPSPRKPQEKSQEKPEKPSPGKTSKKPLKKPPTSFSKILQDTSPTTSFDPSQSEPEKGVTNYQKEDAKKKTSTKDDAFREFRRLCADVANADAYTAKTAIVKKMFTKGSSGDGFKSDLVLWCKMLLPGAVKRVYNLQSKQLIKLFARILVQEEEDMLQDLEQGDIAETIRVFFDSSHAVTPATKSVLTIRDVDRFLERLSLLTREEDQMEHFKSILNKCTGNDLKMIIRLVKSDLRINAGPKHILGAIHEDAYKAFQVSRDLEAVIERCTGGTSTDSSPLKPSPISSGSPSAGTVALSLMTPVLPMLAEACKSVDMAMKKCPYGMLAEVKYDGERVQVHKKGNEFRYFSRSLKPVLAHKVNLFKDYIPKAFPDGDDLILDSEVLMVDTKTGQPLPFGSLGIHKKAEFKDANVCLFIFDCIYYNGEVLLHKSMQKRREILSKRISEIPNRIMLSEVKEINDPQDLTQMIMKTLKLGLEGLVLKDVNGKYEPGKRYWLKVKKDYLCGGAMADTADLVVLGAWYGTGNKGGMMSVFLMGCYDKDRDVWLTVTKVHTGHDDATLEQLQKELDMIKIAKDPNKIPKWMKANKPMIPDFVARDPKRQPVWEITGAEFTNQGVHTAEGISIRFPRVTRIRNDKNWETATSLQELRELFKKSSESIDFSHLLGGDNGKVENEDCKGSPTLLKFFKKEEDETTSQKRKREVVNDEEVNEYKIKVERLTSIKKEIAEPSTSGIKYKDKKSNRIKEEPIDFDFDMQKKLKTDTDHYEELQTFNNHPNIKIKIEKSEKSDSSDYEDESRAKYYAFVKNDYIEYSASGNPLNWIEGRKPAKGLPADAKPLSRRMDSEMKLDVVLRDVRASLAHRFDKNQRKHAWRTLKTLGATILRRTERSRSTHVIHSCNELPSTLLEEFLDVPRTAKHVNLSWLEECAAATEMRDTERHAVKLTGDYCECSHGRR